MADDDMTAPAKTDPETGTTFVGDYPLNHRKRAEALAKARKTSDPDGLIPDELIVDAKERVARLDVAEREAKAKADAEAKAAETETKAADTGAAAKGN